jgi:hypothetical protein
MSQTTNFNEAVGNVIMRQMSGGNVLKVTLYPEHRKEFFNELTAVFEYMTGGFLTVGIIQRNEGDPCESHS